MKYGELNLGQVEAIVNKLGGMDGVDRFLRGETVVKMLDRIFPTWKTIRLGTYRNVKTLKSAITDAGFRISDWSNDILGKRAFTLASEETSLELVTATVAELGFTENTRYDAICARIRELGYDLCPAEVGPQLRLQYKDQPLNEWLVIAMEAISGSDGSLGVFGVGRGGDGRWLCAYCGGPGSVFFPGGRFVFVRRK